MNEDRVGSCGFQENLWVGDIKKKKIGLCQLIFRGRFGDWKPKAKYVGRSFEEGGNLTNIEKKNNRDF